MGIFILACVIWSRKCKRKKWFHTFQLNHGIDCTNIDFCTIFHIFLFTEKYWIRAICVWFLSLFSHMGFLNYLYIETWIEKTSLFVNKCYLYFIIVAYFGLLIPKLDIVLQHKITCLLRPVWKCPSNCFRISLIK